MSGPSHLLRPSAAAPRPSPARAPALKTVLRRRVRRIGHALWNDKVAATHVVFFIIAAAIFIPLVVGLFLYTQDLAETQKDPSAGLESRASSALTQITNNPGRVSGSSSTAWEKSATIAGVDQVGVRDETTSALSYTKVDNLQRGGITADPTDSYLNYEEFRSSLNIGDRYDLHLRLFPVPEHRTIDPYGSAPLKGYHVAYVADVTVGTLNGAREFTDLSAQASDEIVALTALGMGAPSDSSYGFDGKSFVPPDAVIPLKVGDVIADSTVGYRTQPLNLLYTQPYNEYFVYHHLKKPDGTFRYDAIIFGTGVDLNNWKAYDSNFTDFVQAGGTLIFMSGDEVDADDFVVGCTNDPNGDEDCILGPTGSGQPVTTPDVTNQILSIPNQITEPGAAGDWNVCDDDRLGFIPISVNSGAATCQQVKLGVTSSDRYGSTGGTVILSSWNVNSTSQTALSSIFSNFLNYGILRPLYLDYGREIPKDEPVASASRLMTIELPTGVSRDVKLILYLWHRG